MIACRGVGDLSARNQMQKILELYRRYAGRPTLLTYIRHFHDLGYFRKSSARIDSSPRIISLIFSRGRYLCNPWFKSCELCIATIENWNKSTIILDKYETKRGDNILHKFHNVFCLITASRNISVYPFQRCH